MYRPFLRIALTAWLLLSSFSLVAQHVTRVDAHQNGTNIIVTYHLDSRADVSLHLSTDGGLTYGYPLSDVTGDVGLNVKAGDNAITWNPLASMPEFTGENVVFKVVAKKPLFTEVTYLLHAVPAKPLQPIFGVTYARNLQGKWYGWYAGLTTSLALPDNDAGRYEYWEIGERADNYNGTVKVAHHCLSAGAIAKVADILTFYAGVNAGVNAVLWQTIGGDLVTKSITKGVGFDAGVMMNLHGATLSVGGASVGNCLYTKFGIGFTISSKQR